MQTISVTVNGKKVEKQIDERALLLEFIRDDLALTGTHNGCFEAKCGCCTVLMNDMSVKSCNVLALQAQGCSIGTVEGLSPQTMRPVENLTTEGLTGVYKPLEALGADENKLGHLQAAFRDHGAVQCGFCTAGILMAMTAFLSGHPDPTADEVRIGLSGNLCRCTGYQSIVDAVLDAAARLQGERLAANPV
jgi:carbon-monoxide dehydrogenase small subunit